MGSLNPPPELTLDFKPTFIPKTIGQFLTQLSRIGSVSDKIFKLDDFVSRLEAEMRKIDAFKRELPLCMLLINDAILALKEEAMVFRKSSNAEPVLAEFIPLKSSCDQDAEADMIRKEKSGGDKKNWLSSTQLWNTNNSNPNTNQTQNQKPNSTDTITKKRAVEEDNVMINESFRRGFIPIIRNELPIPGLSLMSPGIKNPVLLSKMSPDTKLAPCSAPNDRSTGVSHGQTSRKQRRSWSTELHRRFVSALQQLGGSQAATPKQIRELMQVEGLTNDEVKSHLQKYRLHTRRLHTDPYIEPGSKHGNCQSNSPDGPFITATTTGGTSTTGGDSMEDGEDARSENCCWKGV